jgi:hypothetical protein
VQTFTPISPTELIAAILAGWAVAWAMTAVGLDPSGGVLAGLIIWAATAGKYRRRAEQYRRGWNPPQPNSEP